MKKEKLIQRYNLVERLNHWIVAFCFVTLALSGIGEHALPPLLG